GGQILVSSLVQTLAARHSPFSFSPVGLVELRGLPEPVSALEVVYERASREQLPLPPELAAAPAGRSSFVGRSGERERLASVWRLAEAGERQLTFVSGEPGIGKSRLSAEFAAGVYGDGGVVLWGRCFEEALAPYQPFVQALRHYVTTCDPDELHGTGATQLAPLVRLLPELGQRAAVPPDEEAGEIEAETERYRLFEAIAVMLARIAADTSLLLVLDDLQWADQGTLLLLRNLVFDARPASLLVLGTYRDSEVSRSHPLAQLQADVLRERPVELIELGGLDEHESAMLVDALLGWRLPSDVARTLRSETEGNPFFLEEVVRHLEELGVVSDPDRLRRVRTTVDALGVPRRVRELIARRVQRLSRGALEALRVASVIGSEFRLDLLAAVLDEDEVQAVALLDEAIEARLLFELPTRIGEYGFTHALIQQALYEEQTANRRAALHRRIAETIEALHPQAALAPDPLYPQAAAALAHHFSLAGTRSLAKVVGYGRAAGDQALALLAYEDAAREFARALEALARTAPDAQGERAELLVLLGAARSRAGDAEAAEAAFEAAAEIATRIGAAKTLAHAALGYGGGTGFGGVWTKFARVDAVLVGFLEEALALVSEDEARLRAQLLGRLAQALYWGSTEERQRSLTLSEEALELARALADPVALAYALDSRHVALWEPDNLEELSPLADEMLRLGEQIGDREIQLQAYAWLITDALERAPLEIVDRYVEAHARLARELGQPYHLWYTEVARAMRAHLAGRFAEMSELVERALRHGQTTHAETAQAVYTIQLLHLKLKTGGLEEVISPLELIAAQSPLPAIHSVLALAYAGAGRRADALAQVELFAADDFASIRRDCAWSSTVCFLSYVVAAFDAREYAPQLYRLLLPFADLNGVAGGAILCLGPVSRYLGMLARVNGDYEQALQHLRHALARSGSLGSEPLVARTQLEKAKVLLARDADGDRARAQELLVEVTAATERLGMAQLARDAAAVSLAPLEAAVQV
ncbi:MAG: ATP-binding protein, partial [Gaiellaceae bacterium]